MESWNFRADPVGCSFPMDFYAILAVNRLIVAIRAIAHHLKRQMLKRHLLIALR